MDCDIIVGFGRDDKTEAGLERKYEVFSMCIRHGHGNAKRDLKDGSQDKHGVWRGGWID